jgi:anti-sigma B factor antagonist
MKVNSIEKYNVVVLQIKDDLKFETGASQFQQIIQQNLERNKKNFVVDLGSVKYVNSSGIGMLIRGYTSATNAGGTLALANINEKMRGLLSITKLNAIFNIYDNVDDALKNLK